MFDGPAPTKVHIQPHSHAAADDNEPARGVVIGLGLGAALWLWIGVACKLVVG